MGSTKTRLKAGHSATSRDAKAPLSNLKPPQSVVAQDAKPGLSAEPGSLIHTLEDLIELMLCGVGDPTRHGSSWVFTPEKRVYGTRHALQPVCQCFELSSTVIICCHCLRCDQHNVG